MALGKGAADILLLRQAPAGVVELLLGRVGEPPVIHMQHVVDYRVDKQVQPPPLEHRRHPAVGGGRDGLAVQVGARLHIVQRRAVHGDHRQLQAKPRQRRQEGGGGPPRRNRDLRALANEPVEMDDRRWRDFPVRSGQRPVQVGDKKQGAVPPPGEPEGVHPQGNKNAYQRVQHAVHGKQVRVDVHGMGNRDAHEHHAGDIGRRGFLYQHRDVNQHHNHHGNQQVAQDRPVRREEALLHQQDQHPGRAAQKGANRPVQRHLDAAGHIRLHAEHGGDR